MKQTMESLRILTIEETYELSDAILSNDSKDIKEELGDLMLHLVFYARIAEEKEAFTEIQEFKEAENLSSQDHQEEEFGDILFSLINYARFAGINPETALEKVNRKFKRRFEFIEANAPRSLLDMSLEEMDVLWNEAKLKNL